MRIKFLKMYLWIFSGLSDEKTRENCKSANALRLEWRLALALSFLKIT
jgi:hypothetical protein